MTEYTPGPWHYQEDSDAYTHIVRAGGNRFITQLSQDTSGVSEANARLIAAAPELLAACRAAFLTFRPDGCSALKPSTYQLVLTAIAKATGTEEAP